MSTQQKRSIGVRLAIRKEGPVVNAYVAEEETMAGAFIIGSLDIGLAERPAIWDRWKALTRQRRRPPEPPSSRS